MRTVVMIYKWHMTNKLINKMKHNQLLLVTMPISVDTLGGKIMGK